MSIDQRVVGRLTQLVTVGESLIDSGRSNQYGEKEIDPSGIQQWRMSCLSILQAAFDESHTYRTEFFKLFDTAFDYATAAKSCLGVLKAAKEDYEGGYIFKTRTLIEAEVFDDFLEQAEHLHQNGYYQAAAVIAGSVLEDGLRKACDREGITLSAAPKLDGMNSELARQGVYNKMVQKQITALADVRNNAAHGKWDAFSKDDVTNMLSQVRAIMATHLS